MRGVLVLSVVVLVLAAPATAAAPTTTQLQHQVVALKAQVAALKAQQTKLAAEVAALQTQTANTDKLLADRITCEHGQAGDTTNFVWHQVMQLFAAVFNAGVPPDLPRFDDGGACQRTGQTRIR